MEVCAMEPLFCCTQPVIMEVCVQWNPVPLHTAFHYQPSIVILLRTGLIFELLRLISLHIRLFIMHILGNSAYYENSARMHTLESEKALFLLSPHPCN